MSGNLKVGVVGLGCWGPNLARNFSQTAGCGLAGLCDLDPSRRASIAILHPNVPVFENFEEMLRGVDLDAVVVAAPVSQHHRLAKRALLAGKHVLVEKPMASSVAECEELIFLARQHNLTLMVGHTFLYAAPVRMIADIVRSGELGELRYINSQRLNLGLFQRDINVTWDLAPHDLSIIVHLLKQLPDSVNCQGNAHVAPGIEDVSNLSMTFPGGQFATIQSSWIEPRKVRKMTVVGSRKMLVYDDIEPLEKIRIYDSRVEKPVHYNSFGEFQYAYHYGDCFVPRIEQYEPLRKACEHFVDCVRNGAEPLSGGTNGLEIVKILEASVRSLRTDGARIGLDANAKPTAVNHEFKRRARIGEESVPSTLQPHLR